MQGIQERGGKQKGNTDNMKGTFSFLNVLFKKRNTNDQIGDHNWTRKQVHFTMVAIQPRSQSRSIEMEIAYTTQTKIS